MSVKLLSALSAILACMVGLTACGDDSLRLRKARCKSFVEDGRLSASEGKACRSNRSVFEKGARASATWTVDYYYPQLLRGVERLKEQARLYNRSRHKHLPPGADIPILLTEEEQRADNWRFFIDLIHADIQAPDPEGASDWMITGKRPGDPATFYSFSIQGVAPYALRPLDNACLFLTWSELGEGCRARVYIEAIEDVRPFQEVTAMAITLTPPTRDEAFRSTLRHEMTFWEPREQN